MSLLFTNAKRKLCLLLALFATTIAVANPTTSQVPEGSTGNVAVIADAPFVLLVENARGDILLASSSDNQIHAQVGNVRQTNGQGVTVEIYQIAGGFRVRVVYPQKSVLEQSGLADDDGTSVRFGLTIDAGSGVFIGDGAVANDQPLTSGIQGAANLTVRVPSQLLQHFKLEGRAGNLTVTDLPNQPEESSRTGILDGDVSFRQTTSQGANSVVFFTTSGDPCPTQVTDTVFNIFDGIDD